LKYQAENDGKSWDASTTSPQSESVEDSETTELSTESPTALACPQSTLQRLNEGYFKKLNSFEYLCRSNLTFLIDGLLEIDAHNRLIRETMNVPDNLSETNECTLNKDDFIGSMMAAFENHQFK